jgi:hypothetical protein
MKKLQKFVVPVNVIVYGEDAGDAVSYVEEALDSSSFITEDGLIGAEVMADDVELYEEEYDDDNTGYEEED